jgi:itaconate CoA-transferase
MLGLQNEREWGAFCDKVLGQPALAQDERFASNSRRVANREALRSLIVDAFEALTAQAVIDRLEKAQIANARMNEMSDLWAHEQLRARGRWVEVETSAGPVPAMLPPGVHDATQARMDPVPALGQHTAAILEELGYSPGDVARLREAGAV